MKPQHSMAAIIAAGGLILALSAPRTGAATRYVWQDSPSPGPPYTTWATAAHVIQQAVDAAQAGETVLVTNGVYTVGAVAIADNQTNRVALTNSVVLRSVNGPDVTVIQGAAAPDGGNGDGAIRCVYVGTNAILSGFTLTNGHAGSGGGAWCEASGVVTNCTLTGNSANDAGGAAGGMLYYCTLTGNSADGSGGGTVGATLYNCALRGNSAQGDGGGAYASTLYNSTLTGNSASDGGGAYGCTLYSCTVTMNSARDGAGGGVSGYSPQGFVSYLYNCIVYHNTARWPGPNYSGERPGYEAACFLVFSCTTPLPPGEGNIDADPQLASATHLSPRSPCIAAGSATNTSGVDIDGEPWANPPSIGADQFTSGNATGPIIVSIAAAYTNVAVGFAISFTGLLEGRVSSSEWDFGDGIIISNQPATSHAWTTPGIHTVTLRGFNVSFPKGISAQIQVTVLEPVHYVNKGNLTPVFPYASWQTAATNIQDAVDAATIPGSLVLVTNGLYDVGGGVNESRVALTNPVVLRGVNGAESTVIAGDGMRCVYVGANAILSGFTLTNGSSGEGGGVWCESSGVVSNCVLTGNSAHMGGGARGGTLSHCTLAGNSATRRFTMALPGWLPGSGGGVADATLFQCILTGNSADSWTGWGPSGGGGASSSTLYNCSISSNSAGRGPGGGVFNSTLHNCALTGNSARFGGGAAGGNLYNCTLTGNSAGGSGGGASGSSLYNCIAYHNTAADGPNHADSIFDYSCTTPLPTNGVGNIDADPQLASTTHLSASSPCIGAGSAAYATGVDIDGEPWGNPPCIGADQLTAGNATGLLAMQIQASYTHVVVDYTVSFTALINGRTLQSVWDFGDGTRLTNHPFASHAWSTRGVHTVRLIGYNNSFPDGISASLVVTVSEGVSYVNSDNSHPVPPYASWATAATSIQDAIDAAVPNGVVLVTNGVYASGGATLADIGASRLILSNAARVQSVNGPDGTTILGDAATRCAYVGGNGILSGFTLKNGHAVNGGGVWCEASGIVSNCVLAGNVAGESGGGIVGGTLYNCALNGNSAGWGGGASSSTLYNCALIGNSALDEGGGASGSTLYNCVMTGNSAYHAGGAIGSTLYNSIVYHNNAGDAPNHADSMFEYSCTTPLPTNGVRNIDTDPQLASTTHLSSLSPCIGAGSAAYASGVDIDGEVWADPPSMGADQLTPGTATGPLAMQIQASYTHVVVDYTVSFTALNTGPILQSVWDFGDGTRLTNHPFASHAWTVPGIYTIRLTGYNEISPDGISATLLLTVTNVVHYVSQASFNPRPPYASWDTAATNIQSAVDAAEAAGSLVLVSNGIYGTGESALVDVGASRLLINKPVRVQSVHGPKATVITGNGVIRCVYLGRNAVLSGFTLTNGVATHGSGVWCEAGASVSNSIIAGNTANLEQWGRGGGGAYRGSLYDCVLFDNHATRQGGGAFQSFLYHCTVVSNSAGYGGGTDWSSLFGCLVTGNSAGRGGAAASAGALSNCVVTGSFGWGVAGSILYNCTLTGNSAGGVTGGVLYNCVVYYNTLEGGPNYSESTFAYSCTTPLPPGEWNIGADPRFVNLAAGDLHLRPDSPCIDAGTNLSAFLTTDLDGLPRPLDGNGDGVARFDMGAYEFNPYRFAPTLQFGPDGFRFTVRGEPGKSVRLERSRDLVHWESAGQMLIPASGQTLFGPVAATEAQLFYRLRVVDYGVAR